MHRHLMKEAIEVINGVIDGVIIGHQRSLNFISHFL